jgi:hypothetical protein
MNIEDLESIHDLVIFTSTLLFFVTIVMWALQQLQITVLIVGFFVIAFIYVISLSLLCSILSNAIAKKEIKEYRRKEGDTK